MELVSPQLFEIIFICIDLPVVIDSLRGVVIVVRVNQPGGIKVKLP
jgi:hypothetical protein